nr:hypothetical protein B0A51_17944 [Rachicladosporium sp. CCFEE 5018]
MFPAQHTLAQNVKLEILDAAADVPLEYIDAFDLIHIRLVLAAVYNNDPRPILRNMIRMLKPGVLQWGEIMLDAYVLGKPREGQKTASMKIMALIAQQIGTTAVAPEDSWLINLPSIFEECGLQGVECARASEPRREMWKYWGNVLSAAIEEIVAVSRLGREYLRDLAAENDRGDYVYVEPRIVTGYKIV